MTTLSPADKFQAARSRQGHPKLEAFRAGLGFDLDHFQVASCESVEDGRGVLVAAPTGAGKTIVAEFAVHLAMLQAQVKVFYTTPMKALSNQKFQELVATYGADEIGLLTGDSSVNPRARVVIMTTEVLRNMLYAGSSTIESLGYVVMDEVHYLADRSRGAVWEEVIIHLPTSVTVIALSATVSNAEEFGAWLSTVRGKTEIIVEEHRPVPLWQHVMAGHHLYDLFVDENTINAELLALARRSHHRGPPGRGGRNGRRGRGRRRDSLTPWRSEVVEKLDTENLLPCIYFLFSRAGCDDAVEQCLRAGLRLTTSGERETIRSVVSAGTMAIADEDLAALGYVDWADALERGIAAHHAGMLPAFKEIVEDLFQRGLIKVVFATETLALGINMPARSVVLERLVKWNGEAHVDLTAGEYTQLTGRAGRRGIDVEGHAVVVWSDELDPEVLAGLASTRTYPLRSSFQASYNMAINLVGQMGRARAREVLETSFAQFQADQSVVGLSAEVRKLKEAQAGYSESMTCHLGDFSEYAALREEITQKEKNAGRIASAQRKSSAEECLARMRPGDVFVIPRGKRSGPAVVIASADRPHDPRPQVLTHERQVRRVSTVDVPTAVPTLGRVKVPKNFSAKDASMRRDLARKAVSVAEDADHHTPIHANTNNDEVSELRARLRAHPCHGCQDREAHARWAERYFRAQRQISDLERRIATRTHSIARQFDRVCETLVDLGYLEGQGDDLQITESGRMLGGLYSESDLLIAQCLKADDWNNLQPHELAAVVACVVYQSRRSEGDIRPAVPGGPIETAVDELFRTWAKLSDVERAHKLTPGPEPDAGLAWAIYRWAKGASLLTILTSNDVSAGDFVRWTRQVIDVLGQIQQAATEPALRDIADRAASAIDRGVVGYAPVLD